MRWLRVWPQCRWCAKRRGVICIERPNGGSYGILLCPRCDWAHDHAAGPPDADRVRDIDPRP